MSQYINLLNPALHKRRDPLSARVLLAAVLTAIFVLAVSGGWARYSANDLIQQARSGEARLKVEREKLVSAVKGAAERKPDTRLIEELVRAEAVLKTRGELIDLIESGALGKTEGFSAHLRALARQSMTGLWLTDFSVGPGGSGLEINGKALNADLLPTYIRKLNSESVFQGQSFAMINVYRPDEQASAIPAGNQGGTTAKVEQKLPHVVFNLGSKMRSAEITGRN
ncbi:MAG TPA: PilN domain-containing protein [Burkholderiales bacterium]|jgi:hypothetical protein|nr:PilN domain-containing protein [Burkholderiales bacterium]